MASIRMFPLHAVCTAVFYCRVLGSSMGDLVGGWAILGNGTHKTPP